jgi:hypothetical protein
MSARLTCLVALCADRQPITGNANRLTWRCSGPLLCIKLAFPNSLEAGLGAEWFMERRRAIAWAGSTALMGCVTALMVGSLLGGFGLGGSREPQPQPIGPGSKPQTTHKAPAPDAPQVLPAPDRAGPGAAPGDSVPLAANIAAPPVPDAGQGIEDYSNGPVVYTESPKIVVVPRPNATTSWRDIPVLPREVNKPDTSAKKNKSPPAPIAGKQSNRGPVIAPVRKRAAELARIRDILKEIPGSKAGRAGPRGDHDVPAPGRLRGVGSKGGIADSHPRGRNDGRDG